MEYSEETEEFKKIEYFYRNYDSREALWWYTHDTFIYRQLNAAMRLKDLNKIFLFREFIIDIHTQLLKLHSNMIMADNVDERRGNQSLLTIYKAQYMEVNKVQNLVKNIGNLLSVDTYLFTTNEKKTAMSFFRNNKNCQLTPFSSILFEFNIDIHVVTKPYANILVTDDKYLISMGTVFRITSATVMPETDIWIVKLDLSSEETRQLKKLGDYYKCQISTKAKTTDSIAYEAMKTFGDFLVTLKEYTKAEIYYNNILKYLPTNYPLLAQIYNKIGKIYWYKNDANNSLKLHSKALQICENSTPCNYLLVAKTYSYIGRSYSLKNDNMMALISHKTSLEIQQKYANYEHIDFVEPLNNMGEILTKIGDYSAALVNLEKALDICLNVSPSNYLLLSTTYNNIGWLHLSAGDYSKALVSFNKMSEYECNFLPKNSSSFGTTYNLLGYVHYLTGDNTIALLYYLKALDVYSKCYPSMKHWSVAEVYRNIGQVYFKQLDYSKSLEMYDKAFDIYQKYGWNSFQDSIQFLRGYSQIYNAKQQFRKALKYTNKALEIQLEHVPSDFIAISSTYTSIGQIYRQIGDNLNSSEYFKLALRTLLKVKNNINIVILVQAYCNVATALFSTGEYDSALSHFQLALDVYTNECQDSISLSDIYNLMGVINQKNGDYESALKLHEKALEQETDSTKIEAIYNEIGTIYCKICKYDEALNNIKKGLEQKEKEMSSSSYYQLALIYCKTKTGTII
ncbi:unnamed protein product [Didymodactylos carnosus]|nr:unnamed protein product [Didymodactylos carnosus]CAF4001801.1 unnamed protein product [Didymodactylos carnosus]